MSSQEKYEFLMTLPLMVVCLILALMAVLAIIHHMIYKFMKEKENMRVYIKKEEPKFRYPEDMEKILTYLREHGEIKVSDKYIEVLYEDFSDDVYCAGWIGVNDQMLKEFADWLNEKEI